MVVCYTRTSEASLQVAHKCIYQCYLNAENAISKHLSWSTVPVCWHAGTLVHFLLKSLNSSNPQNTPMLHPQQYIALHKLAPNITPTSPSPQHIYIHIHTYRLKSFPEQTPTRQALHNQPVTRRPPASSRHHMHTRDPQAQRTHAPILTHPRPPLHRWRQRSTKVPQIGSRSRLRALPDRR